MTHPSPHSSQTTETEEENISSSPQTEEEVQAKYRQTLEEETPEISGSTPVFQFLGVLGFWYVSERAKVLEALRFINSQEFTQSLLQVKNPSKLEEAGKQLEITREEIERQQKKWKKGEEKDFIEAGIGPFRRKVFLEDYHRRFESYKLARLVQGKINGEVYKEQIARTTQIYGLNEEGKQRLIKGMAKWLKENPGRTVEDYLVIEGRKIAERQIKASGGKVQKAELEAKQTLLAGKKTKKGKIPGLLETIREEKIKENLPQIRTARRVIADLNDKTKEFQPLTPNQIQQIIHQGKYPSAIPSSPPFLKEESFLQTPSTTTSPTVKSSSQQILPTHAPPISPPTTVGFGVKPLIFNRLANYFSLRFSFFQKFFSPLTIFRRGFQRSFLRLGIKVLGRQTIRQIAGLIAPGVGNLITFLGGFLFDGLRFIGRSLTGIDFDIEKWILKAALFVVGVVIGIAILVFILIPLSIYGLFSHGLIEENTQKTPSLNQTSWQNFEKNFLLP